MDLLKLTILDGAIEMLNAYFEKNEIVVTVNAPVKTSVMVLEKGYRAMPISSDTELLIKKLRLGLNKKIIFETKPLDGQAYVMAEFTEKDCFEIIKSLRQHVNFAMLHTINAANQEYSQKTTSYTLAYFEDVSWLTAKKRFLSAVGDLQNKMIEIEKISVDAPYLSNPNYGSF